MGFWIVLLGLIGGRGGDAVVVEDPSGGRETAASAPQIALAPDGAALLAWESRSEDGLVVRFARRDPGAAGKWGEVQTLSDGPGLEPRLAAGAAGHVQIVWLAPDPDGYRGRTRRSADGGRSWAPPEFVAAAGPVSHATVATGASGEVWIAWEDQGAGERDILLARSEDAGRTWIAPRRVDADVPGSASSFHPDLLPVGDGVLVSWWDLRHGLADVYVRRMEAGSGADGPETRLDPGAPGSVSSHEASLQRTESGRLRARWREGFGGAPFLARESGDGGRTWSPATPDPPAAAPARLPGTEAVDAERFRHRVRVIAVPGRLEYERAPTGS